MMNDKRVVVTGGTGSLGKVLVRRLLCQPDCMAPRSVTVFSRDEAKQNDMRLSYLNMNVATDEVIYRNIHRLKFVIGDVRDFHSVASVLRDADIVINAAALKQVPICEYFPYEATRTNIGGPENIVRAIKELNLSVQTVIGISTDKACEPCSTMGMTKALQERLFVAANLIAPNTRFICVRYGNVLASRGSVIPLFHDQIRKGGPVTITDENMTRFFINLNGAVDTIFQAQENGRQGETYVPFMSSVRMSDLAAALIGDRDIPAKVTGVRPGEKMDEILVSSEEAPRTYTCGKYYVIQPSLPELCPLRAAGLSHEYSSKDQIMDYAEVCGMLRDNRLMVEDDNEGELLR